MGPKAIPAKREETSSSSAGVVVITMDPDPEPEQDKPDKLQEAKAKMAEDPWASVVAAIQDNAKAVVDGLKEQKKPKPVPSGIKPRRFILPVLTLLVFTLPILCIVVPVGLTSKRQIANNNKDYQYLCVLKPMGQVPANASKARLFYEKYLIDLKYNCTQASEEVWAGHIPTPGEYNITAELTRGWMLMDITMAAVDPLFLTAQVNADIRFNYKPVKFDVPPNPFADDYQYEYDGNETALEAAQLGDAATGAASVPQVTGRRLHQTAAKTPAPAASTLAAPPIAKVYTGAIVDVKKKLSIPKDQIVDVVFATSSGTDAVLKSGDRAVVKQLKINMDTVSSLFNYPFDSYKIPVKKQVTAGNSTVAFYSVPLFVRFHLGVPGWKVVLEPGLSWSDQYIDDYWTTYLNYSIYIQRSSFVKFFACMILAGMWLLTACAVTYAMDLIYMRPRNATTGDAALFTGLLFAMNGIRGVMPGVPPVGQAVDYFGFIWLMMFMMVTAAQVYSKVMAQYVHEEPTAYDKVFKTEALAAWLKLEAEKKAKEEEKKRKEAEKKAKENANRNNEEIIIKHGGVMGDMPEPEKRPAAGKPGLLSKLFNSKGLGDSGRTVSLEAP